MANWSKRRSWKNGNAGQRRTYTTTNTGKSTTSYSSKVGNRRVTNTMSGGKMKQTVTETHPTLGRRTTTKNLTPAYKPPKKPKKSKPFKFSTNKSKRANTGTSWWNEPDNSSTSTFWIVVAIILVLIWIFS